MTAPSRTPPTAAADLPGLRRFGWTTALVLVLLFTVLPSLWRHRPLSAWPVWPLYPAAPLAVLALVAPSLLAPVRRGWMALGRALGWVNTRILLTAVFFLIVTPLGLLRRLSNQRPLRLSRSPAPSYRVPSARLPRERMKEMF